MDRQTYLSSHGWYGITNTDTSSTLHRCIKTTSPVADDDQLHILLAEIENDLPYLGG